MEKYLGWKKYKRSELDTSFALVAPHIEEDMFVQKLWSCGKYIGEYVDINENPEHIVNGFFSEDTDLTVDYKLRTFQTSVLRRYNGHYDSFRFIDVHNRLGISIDTRCVISYSDVVPDEWGYPEIDISDIDFEYGLTGLVFHSESQYMQARMML